MKSDLKSQIMSNVLIGTRPEGVSFKRQGLSLTDAVWWIALAIAFTGLLMLVYFKFNPLF